MASGTTPPDARPSNLAEMICSVATGSPSSEAFVDGDVRLDYESVYARACAVARRLIELQVSPGDRIAIVLPNSWRYAVTYFGIQLAGGIAVLVNARLTVNEIEHILSNSGAGVVVTNETVSPTLASVDGRQVVMIDDLTSSDLASGTAALAIDELPGFGSDPSDTAHLLYTSGTTGRPKGAMQTHANLLFNAETVKRRIGAAPGERTLIAAPLFHAVGMVSQLIGFVTAGACCVFTPAFRVETTLALMVSERITFFSGVAAMLRLILLRADAEHADLSALRLWVMGGSPVPESFPAEVLKRLPNLVLGNVWGMTESTSISTYVDGDEYLSHAWSVGRTVDGIRAAISVNGAAPEDLRNTAGELCLSGPAVVAGYWGNPDATASTFVDGWLHTGDVGSIDDDGYIRVLDRLKDMIIRGGENIYCLEVESVLAAHTAVADVAVVGVEDPIFDERVRAVVVLRPDAAATVQELTEFARLNLAEYKIPVEYLFFDELPRNASGKVIKRDLALAPASKVEHVPR